MGDDGRLDPKGVGSSSGGCQHFDHSVEVGNLLTKALAKEQAELLLAAAEPDHLYWVALAHQRIPEHRDITRDMEAVRLP
jgi:hypothetical protein